MHRQSRHLGLNNPQPRAPRRAELRQELVPGGGSDWRSDIERFLIPNSTWRVIVLDSTQSDGGDGYRAYLDPEQLVWLTRELNEVDRKARVLILSHIPIVSLVPVFVVKAE